MMRCRWMLRRRIPHRQHVTVYHSEKVLKYSGGVEGAYSEKFSSSTRTHGNTFLLLLLNRIKKNSDRCSEVLFEDSFLLCSVVQLPRDIRQWERSRLFCLLFSFSSLFSGSPRLLVPKGIHSHLLGKEKVQRLIGIVKTGPRLPPNYHVRIILVCLCTHFSCRQDRCYSNYSK